MHSPWQPAGDLELFGTGMVLLKPEMLWLALLLVPAIFLGARRLVSLAPWRRRLSAALQTLSALLLVFAVAEPALIQPNSSLYSVLVLDSSASLSDESRTKAVEYARSVLDTAGPLDNLYFISAASSATLITPEEIRSGSWAAAEAQNQTDLSAALRLASTLLEDTGRRRVTLVTDGWETRGTAVAEADRLRSRGVAVEVAPLVALGNPEVVVRGITASLYAREGDPIHADLSVYSTLPTSATLRLTVDGGDPIESRITLQSGENNLPIRAKAGAGGFHRIEAAVLSDADTHLGNNTSHATVVVKAQPSVLVLEDRSGESSSLASALRSTQVDVTVGNSTYVPANLDPLLGYDSIVLYNMAATSFTLDQQRTLREWVRRMGKGLVVIGGGTSYALGGYLDSVFEEMLPVSSRPAPRPEQGETALILVMDRSASMDEYRGQPGVSSKFSMALEAVRLAVDSVRTGDTVGVLSFDTEIGWVSRPQVINSDGDKESLKGLISQIELGGGTSIFPALREAARSIKPLPSASKHIVLLTDGREYHNPDYSTLLADLRQDGVTLSCIAIGSDSDRELLTRLAKLGQGRYYFTERPENIPKIVFKELDLALREALIEGDVQPHLRTPSPILRGYAPQNLPQLGGYSITLGKDDATVALTADAGHPLLAHWNYGLGRVVAWTSDAGPKWAQRWVSWESFADFWNGAVRWSMASPVNRQLQPSVEVRDGTAYIAVESLTPTGSFSDLEDVEASLRSPDGVVTTTRLTQTAPGRYEAQVPVGSAGAYEVRVSREGENATGEAAGFSIPIEPELLNAGTNARLLGRISTNPPLSLDDPRAPLNRENLTGAANAYDPVWQPFLGAGLLLLLASVAVRRLAFRLRKA